jgi:hypothetical protein
MANFLAYFDLLGYKKFIENNTEERLDYRTNHFGRNIEIALALDRPTIQSKRPGVVISDISHSTLNCLTFSDTVILWTNSNALEDFTEILQVAHKYNNFNILHDFPSRGCVVYGDIWYKPFDSENLRGGKYMLNMIYGKALIDAHSRAEAMSWAGCELDKSAIEYANTLGNIKPLLQEYTMVYDIPFKTKDGKEIRLSGHALRLFLDRVLIIQYHQESIRRAFTQDNKGEIEGRTKTIFDNTIEFLKAHQINFPFYYHMAGTKSDSTANEIFGRLEENYTHTIIKVIDDGQKVNLNKSVTKFDRDKSDRDFLEAEEISHEIFEEQLMKFS